MAISKMKLINISGPITKYETTATEILRSSCFAPVNVRTVISGFKKLIPFEDENPYKNVLENIENMAQRAQAKLEFKDTKAGKNPAEALEFSHGYISKIKGFEEDTKKYSAQIEEAKLLLKQLDYLSGINVDIANLFGLSYIKFRFGRMKNELYRKMTFLQQTQLKDNPYDTVYREIKNMAAKYNFEVNSLAQKKKETAERATEKLKEYNEKIQLCSNDIFGRDSLIRELAEYCGSIIFGIGLMCANSDVKEVPGTKEIVDMSGWASEESNPYLFVETGRDGEYIWGIYFAPRVSVEYVDTLFAALQFERFRISDRVIGNPGEVRSEFMNELAEAEKNMTAALHERSEYEAQIKDDLERAYATLTFLDKAEDLKKTSAHSQNNFYMAGWVPVEDFYGFVAVLEEVGDLKYIVENTNLISAATPTKLNNPRIFRPFESFIRMYGVPGYGEIDPTPLVALSYMLFFGIMFADIGQGFVLALLGFILYRFKKMEFGKVFISCGTASMIFGALFDSIFGYEGTINRVIFGKESIVYGYSPTHNMMSTLLIAVAIGVGFILLVMCLNIYNRLRGKEFGEALFSHNGAAGLVLYSSILWLVADKLLLGNKAPISKLYIICLCVLPLALIFLRIPLTSLITGRKKLLHGGIGEFLIETFFEIFEDVLSFITNTVSFVRVGAFALAHAGMMFVVFLLANTTATATIGSGNLVVVIIGNLLIMGLEGLVVGIQALRLEFYELFSRFYTGDGVEFVPATIDGKKDSF